MITAAHVRADVVDIRPHSVSLPDHFVADANVLYWVFYPNFAGLTHARARFPAHYQLTEYPSVWTQAARDGCEFYTSAGTLAEFAKLAEVAGLETHWLLDRSASKPPRNNGQFPLKVCRYCYPVQLAAIRQDVESLINGILGSVALLHQLPTPDQEHQAALTAWLPSAGDFPDAATVAAGVRQGFTNFLSDDADLATFAGITLYTANRNAITAAQAAGRLVT